MTQWNPEMYLRFADQRSRPFYDLTARIAAAAPTTVVDLGCGPGQLTASLAIRWPDARIAGIDSSPEMIAAAQAVATEQVSFAAGDVQSWTPAAPVDVIISNAALQWVPDHLDLLPHLVAQLSPGGWLAFQVPANFDQASHVLLHRLAGDPRFAAATTGLERPGSFDPVRYLSVLNELGCTVDVWETTYLHVLDGPDPVFRWISGTGARPVLQALGAAQRAEFEAEYKAQLRAAYPEQEFGTVLPFRRIFVVAQATSEPYQPSHELSKEAR